MNKVNNNNLTDNVYHYYKDEETGEILALDINTGEVLKTKEYIVPYGTKIYTPKSQERYKAQQNIKLKRWLYKTNNKPLGSYYFVSAIMDYLDLNPATVTRLIYLNTFLSYSGRYITPNGRSINRENLHRVLKISKSTTSRFWNEVSPTYIQSDNDGIFLSNKTDFLRGELDKRKFKPYQQIYIEGVRRLYEAAQIPDHKSIGYIFLLLPFINREYNILCHNPFECDIDKIIPMSLHEFCDQIGFDKSHVSKLVTKLKKICFTVNDHMENFISFVSDGGRLSQYKMFINPHILYCGSDYKKVEVLGAFHNAQ